MNIWVVLVPVEEPDALVFVFDDSDQAQQFADHVRDLYNIGDVTVLQSGVDTYDSAIEALVEAIGPSDE